MPVHQAGHTVALVNGLVAQIERTILEKRLLEPRASVLIAVSGGLDSIVLLRALHTLAPAYGWRLAVAHFNHQLRGQASDADQAFVREVAAKLGLPFRTGHANVRGIAAKRGLSIEMAARHCRHRFLARTALALGIGKIATGHHADDQLELFFLRLLRGAGPEGLGGMEFIGSSPANPRIRIIRPLLAIRRSGLEQFAREGGIRFQHDATNDLLDCERNRVRHELLPLLREQFGSRLDSSIPRLMELLRAESDFVAQQAREAQSIKAGSLGSLHPALQRRIIRSECLRLGIIPDFELIEGLRQSTNVPRMISPGRVASLDAAGKLQVRTASRQRFKSGRQTVDLGTSAGKTVFGQLALSWRIEPWAGWPTSSKCPPPDSERFDADAVGARVQLRYWQPGDRFHPVGMKAPVKLQDLFVNSKVPPNRRRELVVAESTGGELFWVEGLRISERFKIREGTRRCLVWHWEPAAAE